MSDGTTILALDPSTDVTGVALVTFARSGDPLFCRCAAFHAPDVQGKDLAARIARIRIVRNDIEAWLTDGPAFSHVACESFFHRGKDATEAGIMAGGSYLTLDAIADKPICLVTRSAACSAAGCWHLFMEPRGETSREQEDKRRRLKAAVIAWANLAFSSCPSGWVRLNPDEDAIADALAVAVVAHSEIRQATMAAIQRPLFGRGSGTKRGVSSEGPRKTKTTEEATAAVAEVA